jgi:hypothetical protein
MKSKLQKATNQKTFSPHEIVLSNWADEQEPASGCIYHPCTVFALPPDSPEPTMRAGIGLSRHTRPRPGFIVRYAMYLDGSTKQLFPLDAIPKDKKYNTLCTHAEKLLKETELKLEMLAEEENKYDVEHGLTDVQAAPFHQPEQSLIDSLTLEVGRCITHKGLVSYLGEKDIDKMVGILTAKSAIGKTMVGGEHSLMKKLLLLLGSQSGELMLFSPPARGDLIPHILDIQEQLIPKLSKANIPTLGPMGVMLTALVGTPWDQRGKEILKELSVGTQVRLFKILVVWTLRLCLIPPKGAQTGAEAAAAPITRDDDVSEAEGGGSGGPSTSAAADGKRYTNLVEEEWKSRDTILELCFKVLIKIPFTIHLDRWMRCVHFRPFKQLISVYEKNKQGQVIDKLVKKAMGEMAAYVKGEIQRLKEEQLKRDHGRHGGGGGKKKKEEKGRSPSAAPVTTGGGGGRPSEKKKTEEAEIKFDHMKAPPPGPGQAIIDAKNKERAEKEKRMKEPPAAGGAAGGAAAIGGTKRPLSDQDTIKEKEGGTPTRNGSAKSRGSSRGGGGGVKKKQKLGDLIRKNERGR